MPTTDAYSRLRVAAPLAFAVGKFFTPHTPAVRGKVSHLRKSPDVAGLQHDRQRQDFSDPTNGKQIPIRRLQSDSIFHGPFQTCDLGFECSHDRQIRFHRQSQIQLTNSRPDPKASRF